MFINAVVKLVAWYWYFTRNVGQSIDLPIEILHSETISYQTTSTVEKLELVDGTQRKNVCIMVSDVNVNGEFMLRLFLFIEYDYVIYSREQDLQQF